MAETEGLMRPNNLERPEDDNGQGQSDATDTDRKTLAKFRQQVQQEVANRTKQLDSQIEKLTQTVSQLGEQMGSNESTSNPSRHFEEEDGDEDEFVNMGRMRGMLNKLHERIDELGSRQAQIPDDFRQEFEHMKVERRRSNHEKEFRGLHPHIAERYDEIQEQTWQIIDEKGYDDSASSAVFDSLVERASAEKGGQRQQSKPSKSGNISKSTKGTTTTVPGATAQSAGTADGASDGDSIVTPGMFVADTD